MHETPTPDTAEQPQQPQVIGATIEDLFKLKAELEAANKAAKAIEKQIEALEVGLLAQMAKDEVLRLDGKTGYVSRTENVVPNVEDWDQFYQYLYENEAAYLLHKRVSATAMRELFDSGMTVPGVKPVTMFRINARKH